MGGGWEEGKTPVCHKVLIVSMRTDVKCAQLTRWVNWTESLLLARREFTRLHTSAEEDIAFKSHFAKQEKKIEFLLRDQSKEVIKEQPAARNL